MRKDGPMNARTEIYSLGCVLNESLTGQPPFSGREGFVKRFTEPPAPPSSLRRELPTELDELVVRSLAREAHDRFPSAEELVRALGDVSLAVSTRARPGARPNPLLKKANRLESESATVAKEAHPAGEPATVAAPAVPIAPPPATLAPATKAPLISKRVGWRTLTASAILVFVVAVAPG